MLVCLGLMYFELDRRLDLFTWDKESLIVASDLYSNELSESIVSIENLLFQQKRSRNVENSDRYAMQERISFFYSYLRDENSDDLYSRLKDGIKVTDSDFHRSMDPDDDIGIDDIDFKYLYRNYISKFIRTTGCFAGMRDFYPKTTFNDSIGMYITKIIYPYHSSRFLMIYRGHAYSIDDFKVQVHFSAEDIDRGYANVIIRDLITYDEIEHKIVIPSYAFKV